jgi:hypothetical protein
MENKKMIEAMKQALEVLEFFSDTSASPMDKAMSEDAITSLRQAIAVYESAPPEAQTEAEKTAFAHGWFRGLEAQRTKEK